MRWFIRTGGPGRALDRAPKDPSPQEHNGPSAVLSPSDQADESPPFQGDPPSVPEGPRGALLPLAEAVLDAASGLRGAVGPRVPMETAAPVLDSLFWTFDHFLAVLSGFQDAMQFAHETTVATGRVWDDADAARVRARLETLDEAMVNLAACRETLSGVHVLLGHATSALFQLDTTTGVTTGDTAEDPVGDPAGTDKEAMNDE